MQSTRVLCNKTMLPLTSGCDPIDGVIGSRDATNLLPCRRGGISVKRPRQHARSRRAAAADVRDVSEQLTSWTRRNGRWHRRL